MRVFRIVALLTAAGGLLASASCGKDGSAAHKVTVVAAFFPMADVARVVGGGHVDVQTLTPLGVEPHDVALDASHSQQERQADVLIYLSHGFQPAVSALVSQAEGRAVDALAGLPVVGDDPHVWLDPVLLQRIVVKVEGALAQVDPAHRGDYAANSRHYRDELGSLDRRFNRGLAECDRNILVTSHAAFLYLASRYRLEQEAIAGASPASVPTPVRLTELAALVKDAGVTTIFTEPLVTGGPAATLAQETGVTTAVLDPVEGRMVASRPSTYLQSMGRNLAALRVALGCL
ncbi:MAG: zinc transport system substrate-binding protein [Actinomycetota bacterium]